MFAIVFSDPGNLAGPLGATLLRDLKVALWEWSAAIDYPSVTVHLSVVDTIPTADTAGEVGGVINMRINPAYFRQYVDPNPDYLPGDPIAPGKDAPDYWALHELGHGFGINREAMAPWLSTDASGVTYFTGPSAVAVFGRPVPITSDGEKGHLGNAGDDALLHDIMSGTPHSRNYQQVISAVDLAILRDVGVAMAPAKSDELVGLYLATFGRPPDAEGLAYWEQRREAGMPLAQIAQSFMEHSEAQALSSGARLVEDVYQHVFGRAADSAGLAYWSDALASGQVHEGQFVLAVLQGAQGEDARHIGHAADEYAISLIGLAP